MTLHDNLLEQAIHLAIRERRGRPRQASLRRAISAAYYALFHLLIDEAARLILPGSASAGTRSRIERSFGHAEMKKVSQAFNAPPTRPADDLDRFVQALPPPSADLSAITSAFVHLQEARHEADYNTARRYTRGEVTTFVEIAERAFQDWKRIRSQPEARTYLNALAIWKKWTRF
jgi:hypothetical protein